MEGEVRHAGAARDVEFLFLSIRRRFRDRNAIRREAIAKYAPGQSSGFLERMRARGYGGAAGADLKSKPVLDLGEFRPARAGAGRLARMLS